MNALDPHKVARIRVLFEEDAKLEKRESAAYEAARVASQQRAEATEERTKVRRERNKLLDECGLSAPPEYESRRDEFMRELVRQSIPNILNGVL